MPKYVVGTYDEGDGLVLTSVEAANPMAALESVMSDEIESEEIDASSYDELVDALQDAGYNVATLEA